MSILPETLKEKREYGKSVKQQTEPETERRSCQDSSGGSLRDQ